MGSPIPAICVDRVAIKTRYRELAMAYHPDRGGDAGRFGEIEAVYRVALAEIGGER